MSTFEEGYVYVMYNPIYDRYGEIYKIGQAKDINERLKSYSTSYPEESEIKYSIKHPYYKELEKVVHLKLKNYRMNIKREFFTCSLDIIIDVINEAKECNIIESKYNIKIKEPLDLSQERLNSILNNSRKELYEGFFSRGEFNGLKFIVKFFIEKIFSNIENKLLIECIDKTNNKYIYTDISNKKVITSPIKLYSIITFKHNLENSLYYDCWIEYENDTNILKYKAFELKKKFLKNEFKKLSFKLNHLMIGYF